MNALQYLESIERDPTLGILEPIQFGKKPRIVLPHMHRGHLATLFNRLGYRHIAEIGVCRGHYTLTLCEANPEAKIYAIDPWETYDGYEEKQYRKNPSLMSEVYQDAMKRLEHIQQVRIIRSYSMDAVKQFEPGDLDAVYIDANHKFVEVAKDIDAWEKIVRPGGIIAGHDYARFKHRPTCHVKEVVNAWTYSHHIKPWFVLRGKGKSSWFWAKG